MRHDTPEEALLWAIFHEPTGETLDRWFPAPWPSMMHESCELYGWDMLVGPTAAWDTS